MKIGIVVSKFNEEITSSLLESCLQTLEQKFVESDTFFVPGAFEIPFMAQTLARTGLYDAIICLGAVIRGETPHFEYVSSAVALGVAKVSLDCELPVIFGVLTTDTDLQAEERKETKGKEAAEAALQMLEALSHLPNRLRIS